MHALAGPGASAKLEEDVRRLISFVSGNSIDMSSVLTVDSYLSFRQKNTGVTFYSDKALPVLA
jgi:hypothetical protein